MKIKSFVAAGFVLPGMESCSHDEKEHHEETVEYPVTKPLVSDTSIAEEFVAQVQSIRHIELRALERGYIQDILVDEGEFVHKGQLLFQIMPNVYKAEYEASETEAVSAKIEYENTKVLADSNIVSPNELAIAQARFQKAQAELNLAKVHLDFTEIRAPFDGIVDRFHVRLGSLVEEGELLTNLSDNSETWVYFNLSESEYLEFVSNGSKSKE